MYSNNSIPYNRNVMYRSYGPNGEERFFWAPFVVGGLAGTALGYGLANNNQINNKQGCCGGYWAPAPMPYYSNPYPTYYNNFYN